MAPAVVVLFTDLGTARYFSGYQLPPGAKRGKHMLS
jgi:hypothetical protein